MANFFEGLWGLAKHPFDEAEFMVKGARDVIKGDRSVGDLFGDHQDMMSENITVPLGGHNKITENSDAIAGAIVGGVLAAPLMGGAGAGASAGGGAPVSSAVGMSPAEAIIAGGGNAAEVGSVSTSGAFSRWGNVLNQFGSQITQGSQAQQVSAPAFKPKFQQQQNPSYGSSVMEQLGAANYNI